MCLLCLVQILCRPILAPLTVVETLVWWMLKVVVTVCGWNGGVGESDVVSTVVLVTSDHSLDAGVEG